jgi:hypothetical protein
MNEEDEQFALREEATFREFNAHNRAGVLWKDLLLNQGSQEPVRNDRFLLWHDLLRKHGLRDETAVDLSDRMKIATGKLEGGAGWSPESAENFNEGLQAEVLRLLADGMAGNPDAPKRWRRFEEAFRCIAEGGPPRPPGLEVRALFAFERASNGFREMPAQARVLAMIEEELGQGKLPEGSRKKVLATIAPLYKSL